MSIVDTFNSILNEFGSFIHQIHTLKKAYYLLLFLTFGLSLMAVNRKDPAIRALSTLLGIAIITQIIHQVLKYNEPEQYIVFHIYSLFEYPLYLIYYFRVMKIDEHPSDPSNKTFKKMLIMSFVIYVLFFIIYYTLIVNIEKKSFGYVSALNGFFVTSLSLYYYYDTIKKGKVTNILFHPHFYIVSANFIFFSLQIPILSLDQFFLDVHSQWRETFINIYRTLNFVLYGLYCIGLCINLWEKKKS